jgi:hypothetical protein
LLKRGKAQKIQIPYVKEVPWAWTRLTARGGGERVGGLMAVEVLAKLFPLTGCHVEDGAVEDLHGLHLVEVDACVPDLVDRLVVAVVHLKVEGVQGDRKSTKIEPQV